MNNQSKTVSGITPNSNVQKNNIKTRLTLALLFSAIISMSFIGCDNYPEGKKITLESTTERVSNNWKIAQAIDNGTDVTSNYNQYELNLSTDGTAKLTAVYVFLGVSFDFTTTGTWSFVDESKKIAFNYDNDAADGVYEILKLQKDEMWLKVDGGTLELHYVNQ
jgi:hypothetical protein